MNTPTLLLHRARSLIVKQGWARGTMRDDINRRCILGALHDAAKESRLDPLGEECALASAYIFSAIATYYKNSFMDEFTISNWNDKVCGGKHEAIALFDSAIAIAEQRN